MSQARQARRGNCLVLILPRIAFLKKNATENALKSIFQFFFRGGGGRGVGRGTEPSGGFRAFPAQNLPRLVLKPGYSPGLIVEVWTSRTT